MKITAILTALAVLAPATAFAGCPPNYPYPKCIPWPGTEPLDPRTQTQEGATAQHRDLIAGAASSTALAGVALPSMLAGETSWAVGIGATSIGGDSIAAVGVGIGYGLSDRVSITGKAAFADGAYSAFVGLSGKF